jgi:hypothetical protein
MASRLPSIRQLRQVQERDHAPNEDFRSPFRSMEISGIHKKRSVRHLRRVIEELI